jgi:hypothetical protein
MSTTPATPTPEDAREIVQTPELETLLVEAEALLRRIADESGIDQDIDEWLAQAESARRSVESVGRSDHASESPDAPPGEGESAEDASGDELTAAAGADEPIESVEAILAAGGDESVERAEAVEAEAAGAETLEAELDRAAMVHAARVESEADRTETDYAEPDDFETVEESSARSGEAQPISPAAESAGEAAGQVATASNADRRGDEVADSDVRDEPAPQSQGPSSASNEAGGDSARGKQGEARSGKRLVRARAAACRVVGAVARAVVGRAKSCGRVAARAPTIVLAVLDRPFAGVSPRAKLHVGMVGIITLVMGIVLWLLPSVTQRNRYAEIPLPQTASVRAE